MELTQASACTVLAMLAAFDLRARRLPNVGVATFTALFFIDALLAGASLAALGAHVAAGAIALAATALLFAVRWLGGGDAKLAAAIFLWSGPVHALPVLAVVSVCGGLVAVAMIAVGWMARRTEFNRVTDRLTWLSPSRGVPYGVALAVGGIVAILLQPSQATAQIPNRAASSQIQIPPAQAQYAVRLAG